MMATFLRRRPSTGMDMPRIAVLLAASALVLATSLRTGLQATPAQLPGSNIIPADRLVRWTPGDTVGVPGGIPNGRSQCQTPQCQALQNAAADLKSGLTNASPVLQAAIDSAPAGTVVLIPAGTWRIDQAVSIAAQKDSITLRGSGLATVFDCRYPTCIYVGSGSDYLWSWPIAGNVVSGYTPDVASGGTIVAIADTSAFSPNQLVHFSVANDPSLPVISVAGYGNLRQQMTRVVARTATSLTLYPPIYGYERFAGLAAKVNVAQFQSDFVGIEDLRLDGTNGSFTFGINFEQTYGSWVKNVTVSRSSHYSVRLSNSLGCELRHSWLDELNHTGSNGAGLLVETVSGCLIEDNVIRESFPNIEVNNGSSGNVFAYNFLHNRNGVIGIDTNHGPHNSFNLYEGNVVQNVMSDGYFGSNSEETLFRNLLHGNGLGSGNTLTYCLSLKRFSRNFSIVGNILGSPLHTQRCDAYGQPNIGNGGWSGTAQPSAGDFWQDWNPSTGSTIRGTLSQRTDNFHGVVTLTAGTLNQFQAPFLKSVDGSILYTWVTVGTVAGGQANVDSSPWQVALPPLNTLLKIEPGAIGFQELDLDVEATTLKKANNFIPTGIPAAESLGGVPLPASLYLSSKPGWFGSLTWPPVDPYSPNLSFEVIPAGYRYLHAGPLPPTGVRIVK